LHTQKTFNILVFATENSSQENHNNQGQDEIVFQLIFAVLLFFVCDAYMRHPFLKNKGEKFLYEFFKRDKFLLKT
jgi:hypothetical protein